MPSPHEVLKRNTLKVLSVHLMQLSRTFLLESLLRLLGRMSLLLLYCECNSTSSILRQAVGLHDGKYEMYEMYVFLFKSYGECVYIYICVCVCVYKGKGKAVPLQAWNGPEGSRKLRFPDFLTTAQDGGKVSLTHRPPLPQGNTPGTHFC